MNFQTREKECELMVSLLPKDIKTVLEPTPGKGNLVRVLKKHGYDVVAPNNFWDIDGRFDAVVMNPPFSPMKVGYEILYKVMEMTDVIIALMPWLTIINSKKRTKDIYNFGVKSIHNLPRDAFKGSRVQTCILNMENGYNGKTYIELIV